MAARLLNCKERDEYKCIWGTENGVMLYDSMERAFNKGSVVFVPDKAEFRSVLLDQSLRNKFHGGSSPRPTYGSLDGQLLRIQTDCRPSLAHVYIHALMTILRRLRRRVTGWEHDIERVFVGTTWIFQQKPLRRGTLLALAQEAGDLSSSEAYDFAKQTINMSGVVDITKREIIDQDREIATIVAGTWLSEYEAQR